MGQEDKSQYLAGKLLIATPSMGDTRFHRAVIFICNHDEEGAMGLVINHYMDGVEFSELVKQLKVQSDIELDPSKIDMPVMYGGPVESARGFLLHKSDFSRHETMKVSDQFGVTGTVEALRDVASGEGPDDVLFILGYAGWEAGQLESELQQGAWLVVDSDHDLVFDGEADEKWTRAIHKLGIDPGMLSSHAGSA